VPLPDSRADVGPPNEARGAQSERAYAMIRSRILLGELAPGAKLRVEALQAALALSSTPVREALNRLTAEGLVQFEENRGFRAAPLLASDLRDITHLRVVIEGDALAGAIRHGDDRWEAAIVAAHYRLSQHEKKFADSGLEVGEQWTALHKAFHMALIDACTYPRIVGTCGQLFDQSERYRRFAVRVKVVPRNVRDEHESLMKAVLARQAARALELHRHHIELTGESVARVLSQREGYFLTAVHSAAKAEVRPQHGRKESKGRA
jgi:GntR family carbon starvation induced transcriptional regulator